MLAAVALGFFLYGLWGIATAATALQQLRSLSTDCGDGQCAHRGVLKAHEITRASANGLFGPGGGVDWCTLTMDLDTGTRQAAVIASACSRLKDGALMEAEIWRGDVVSVTTSQGTMGTFQQPNAGLYLGFWRSLALLPFALVLLMIHIDIANHRAVKRLRLRLTTFG